MAGTLLPDSGEIRVGQTRINQLGETARRRFRIRDIGQVFQAFELLEYLDVTENILLGPIIDSAVNEQLRERAMALLSSVGLEDKAHTKPARLSHGERQRVAVCRAMLNRPGLILADEPTGNLDQAAGEQVLGLMMSLAREEHSSLLLVTHSLAVARRADRILTLQEGRLSERGAELAW